MTRLPVALCIVAASAPAAPAQTVEGGLKLVQAIRSNGCAMTEAEAAIRLPALGLRHDETQAHVAHLIAGGAVTLTDGRQFADTTLQLSAALCRADPAGDPALFSHLK
ncbi:MAG: hypothetical protein ACK4KW_13810 [Gemmobacter sp.]